MIRTFPLLCIGAATMLMTTACTRKAEPQPDEQPQLMAGESRFLPMNKAEQTELAQALAPFLQDKTGAELWHSASTRQDTGYFGWCISPAPSEAEWVRIGSISHAELQQLAEEPTKAEHGDTLDYWIRLELRTNGQRLPIEICPAEEFGVCIQGCGSSVRSRTFHKALWNVLDKKYNIQKRFDREVADY